MFSSLVVSQFRFFIILFFFISSGFLSRPLSLTTSSVSRHPLASPFVPLTTPTICMVTTNTTNTVTTLRKIISIPTNELTQTTTLTVPTAPVLPIQTASPLPQPTFQVISTPLPLKDFSLYSQCHNTCDPIRGSLDMKHPDYINCSNSFSEPGFIGITTPDMNPNDNVCLTNTKKDEKDEYLEKLSLSFASPDIPNQNTIDSGDVIDAPFANYIFQPHLLTKSQLFPPSSTPASFSDITTSSPSTSYAPQSSNGQFCSHSPLDRIGCGEGSCSHLTCLRVTETSYLLRSDNVHKGRTDDYFHNCTNHKLHPFSHSHQTSNPHDLQPAQPNNCPSPGHPIPRFYNNAHTRACTPITSSPPFFCVSTANLPVPPYIFSNEGEPTKSKSVDMRATTVTTLTESKSAAGPLDTFSSVSLTKTLSGSSILAAVNESSISKEPSRKYPGEGDHCHMLSTRSQSFQLPVLFPRGNLNEALETGNTGGEVDISVDTVDNGDGDGSQVQQSFSKTIPYFPALSSSSNCKRSEKLHTRKASELSIKHHRSNLPRRFSSFQDQSHSWFPENSLTESSRLRKIMRKDKVWPQVEKSTTNWLSEEDEKTTIATDSREQGNNSFPNCHSLQMSSNFPTSNQESTNQMTVTSLPEKQSKLGRARTKECKMNRVLLRKPIPSKKLL